LLICASSFFSFSSFKKYFHPCDEPIYYSIGTFDDRFGLDKETFKKYLYEASEIWNKNLPQKVFSYKENSNFKVNLVFDRRQEFTDDRQSANQSLDEFNKQIGELDNVIKNSKSEYESLENTYQSMVSDLKNQEAEYRKQVEYWNSRGGAPKGEYEKLNVEAKNLEILSKEVNDFASKINLKINNLNLILKQRNELAKSYNSVVNNYNNKFGHGLEFNQAEYRFPGETGEGEINVYQFLDSKSLLLAITHEFGHALGMEHVENPKSIMYYSSREDTNSTIKPNLDDLKELNRVCKLD
jgi:archaellum component FlaC